MFYMQIPYLSLEKMYNDSIQAILWKKINKNKYIISNGNKVVKVSQLNDNISFSCSESDFYNIWYKYFDLGKSYDISNAKIRLYGDIFEKCSEEYKGVRILRQNIFESLIIGLIYEKVGMFSTKSIVKTLCSFCGKRHKNSMGDSGVYRWNEFPDVNSILKNKTAVQGLLEPYNIDIISICESICYGWLDLDLLNVMPLDRAKEYLKDFVSESVANFVCIYSLGHSCDIPNDNIIENAIKKYIDKDAKAEELIEWYDMGENKNLALIYLSCYYLDDIRKGDLKWDW